MATPIFDQLRVSIRAERPAALATVIDGPGTGRKLLVHRDAAPVGSLGNDDLDRVVSFLSDQHYSGSNLLLFGFADNKGSDLVNCDLSQKRAEAVREQFILRGVQPSSSAGFCSQLPVASNDSEDGREKNRRVEIWLRR